MPKPDHPHHTRRAAAALRTAAAVLAALLVFASVAPAFAFAETDSEGEGSDPPGALPGLEEGGPAGGETPLEELPIPPGEPEVEEVVEEVPPVTVEAEPSPAGTEEPPTPPAAEPVPTPAAAPPAATPGPSPAEPSPPVYGTEEPAPSYEPSPAPSSPVRNEAIVAPGGTGSEVARRPDRKPRRYAAPVPAAVGSTGSVPAPTETPGQAAPLSAATAPHADRPGSLAGRAIHTVAPGDCLWSIAAAVLPARSSDAEIAAEVSRLWRMNAATIGTGDPDLILVGTVLRLR